MNAKSIQNKVSAKSIKKVQVSAESIQDHQVSAESIKKKGECKFHPKISECKIDPKQG